MLERKIRLNAVADVKEFVRADYTEIPKLSRIFRLFERRSRSNCVHEQVAKLDPVSRAAGMDCECPLADKHSPASNARSIKRRVKG